MIYFVIYYFPRADVRELKAFLRRLKRTAPKCGLRKTPYVSSLYFL